MLTIPNSFPPIASDLRQRLEAAYQDHSLHTYAGGQTIPLRDQEIWVVCRGVVILTTFYPTGEEALLGLAGPSAPFGLPLSIVNPYHAVALSAVDLMCLSASEVERSPVLAQHLFRSLSRRLQQAEMMLALMGHRRVEDRLRQFLLLLQQEVSQPVEGGHRLTVRLTHQHLASALGTTRVTITRMMGQLRQEGWVKVDHSRHLILSV